MTKNSVADVLRALATGDKNRSETARLFDIVDEVEAALAAGVSRAAVLQALNDQGFTMTLKSFESALYRIRKKRTKPPTLKAKTEQAQPTKPTEAQPQTPPAPQGEPQTRITNPADIRKSRRREIDLDNLNEKE
jgi:hypothetical protein